MTIEREHYERARKRAVIAAGELTSMGFKEYMTGQEIAEMLMVSDKSIYRSLRHYEKHPIWSGYMSSQINSKGKPVKLAHLLVVGTIAIKQLIRSDEVRGFHPLVESILTSEFDNVYHHVPCDAGIIDFVCCKSGKPDVIVECKVQTFQMSHVRQVSKYVRSWESEVGNATPLLIYPTVLKDENGSLDTPVKYVDIPDGYVQKLIKRQAEIVSRFLKIQSFFQWRFNPEWEEFD